MLPHPAPGKSRSDDRKGPPRSRTGREAPPRCPEDPGSLLLPYALNRLGPAEEFRFEAHLLDCDRCFRDLQALERTGALLEGLLLHERPPPPEVETLLRYVRRRRRVLRVAQALLLAGCLAASFLLGRGWL